MDFHTTVLILYSDQITDSWSEDLGVSYLSDLKGVDRRLDFLLDQVINSHEVISLGNWFQNRTH